MTDADVVELAQRLPYKPLSEDHRRRLKAEIMAQADFTEVRSRRRGWMIGAVIAAAAFVALAIGVRRDRPAHAPEVVAVTDPESVETSAHTSAVVEAPPPETAIAAGVHELQLRDGSLTIDTRTRAPVTIVAGDTRVTIASSRATIVARRGVIVTAQVFAGTAQIVEAGHTRVIEAGEVWTPAPAAMSLELFRVGYEALRAGKYADAIASLDRATDPVVVEDAQFWAAIAAERSGDRDEAARRLRAFMDAFPASPRLDDARSALERVTH